MVEYDRIKQTSVTFCYYRAIKLHSTMPELNLIALWNIGNQGQHTRVETKWANLKLGAFLRKYHRTLFPFLGNISFCEDAHCSDKTMHVSNSSIWIDSKLVCMDSSQYLLITSGQLDPKSNKVSSSRMNTTFVIQYLYLTNSLYNKHGFYCGISRIPI